MSSRRRLKQTSCLAGSALAIMFASTPGMAQEAPATDEPEAVTAVEEIVITGSRIRVQDYTASNPVVSVTGEALENAGVTNVTDFLTDMPALVGSTTLQDNSDAGNRGSVGLNLLNLRNLGTQRTLLLVNGRRHVAATAGDAAVDVNTIPVALIDRIEVLTGGASAVYGADGVSGVVNFVLKDDFEGLDARVQTGVSDQGGGENTFVSVLAGQNFLDGQGNFTLGAEYSITDRVARDDRDFSSLTGRESLVANPNYTGAPGEYQRIFARNARYIDTSPGGSIYSDLFFGSIYGDPGGLSGVDFNGDGTPFQDGVYTDGFTMIGGDGSQLAAFGTDLVPELERASINGTFRLDLSPNHRLFGEAKFVRTQTQFQSQPSFDYSLFVPIDNPYIPEAARQDALAGGLGTPAGMAYYEAIFGEAPPGPGVLVARDNFDLGFITRDVTRDTARFVIGLEGDITPNLAYEVSLNYGRTTEDNVEGNNRINERFFAAVDAVDEGLFTSGVANGNIVCRSDLDPNAIPYGNSVGFGSSPFDQSTWGTTFTPGANSGCVPMNIFGEGSPSQESLDWVLTDSASRDRVEQFVFSAFVTGDTMGLFELPAGPISYAAGVEYRREEALSLPSTDEVLADQLGYDVTWLGAGTTLSGEFDVSEAFAEVSVPLLADLPFAQSLDLDAAYRYSEYSTVGDADAWKLGLQWRMNDSIMFRATQAQAVRAPNISELFLPLSQTFATLSDPCDDSNYQAGINPEIREANCRADLGIGANDPYTFNNTSSSSIEGVIGGNQDLQPETADTFTAGFVLTPTFIPGFSFALDYYDIELTEAVQFFSAQNIVNKCYDLPQPNQFCDLITRDPNNQFIDSFEQFGVNVASYVTSGWDFSFRYVIDPVDFGIQRDIGQFGLSLVGNKLEELTFIEDPNDPLSADEQVGQAFVPEWQATFDLTWEFNDLYVNYGYNWFDETRRYEGRPDDYIDPRYVNYSERSTHDIQVRYDVRDSVTVYGGINNIGDQQPDRGLTDYPVGPLGRYFYLGASMRLGAVGDALFWR